LRPDVLFLDIQMPRISGREMVGMLDPEHRPYIFFLTAFDEYAIKAFDYHSFDYLPPPLPPPPLSPPPPPLPPSPPPP
ncbi:response regulator, partial [Escherichia coli]|uniref:response regulator n=1 Tax=Escherichia coli TaxID=562 RepID=UPI003FA025E2